MLGLRALILGLFAMGVAGSGAAQTAGPPIGLTVDLTDAPKRILHAVETMPVTPGAVTLVYPKWIPGEHAPSGPIDDMAGLFITGNGQPVKWERDPKNMFAFHLTIPAGVTEIEIKMDFLATAAPAGFSAGASTSANLALLSWNELILYPEGGKASEVRVKPGITIPADWRFGTALEPEAGTAVATPGPGSGGSTKFRAVSLETLVDSPVLAGRYFREVALAPEVSPKHYLDVASDGPEFVQLSQEHIDQFSKLVRETGALYKSRHFGSYHFLVTLSDQVAHFGLEHHQSSDDRVPAKEFTDDQEFVLGGLLLPHEFTHSWNGKYRRPAGLATDDYQKPMVGDLLWVYEGLTEYLGDVLAARSGIWTAEQYRAHLAEIAAMLDNRPGRSWRDLEDTARAAQLLYFAGGGYDNWRRNTDYYDEGELLWLDVDTTIRAKTNGKKSLNDFVAAFHGLGGNTPPKVVPYTFEDVVSALNAVTPNDWAGFLRSRLESNAPHAPLGGIEAGGYRLSYADKPNSWMAMEEGQTGGINFWYSMGLHVRPDGTVGDVLKGGMSDRAGVGPGMRIVAVNGRGFTPQVMRLAVMEAKGSGPAEELILENTGFYKVVKVEYHDGERYPYLERTSGTADRMDEILKPMAK